MGRGKNSRACLRKIIVHVSRETERREGNPLSLFLYLRLLEFQHAHQSKCKIENYLSSNFESDLYDGFQIF